jgi:hypothetical protein
MYVVRVIRTGLLEELIITIMTTKFLKRGVLRVMYLKNTEPCDPK